MAGEGEPSKPGVMPTLWIVAAVVAGVLILGDLNRRMANARRLEREARVAQTQVAALEAERARLETQIAAATSGVLVEAWARREAKMALPGEQLIVPMPAAGGEPTPWPTPTPLPPLPSNWEVWWALLFGG